jgi:hypothetical protein
MLCWQTSNVSIGARLKFFLGNIFLRQYLPRVNTLNQKVKISHTVNSVLFHHYLFRYDCIKNDAPKEIF